MKFYYSLLGSDAVYFLVPQQKVTYSYLNNYSTILHVGQSGNLWFDSSSLGLNPP